MTTQKKLANSKSLRPHLPGVCGGERGREAGGGRGKEGRYTIPPQLQTHTAVVCV